MKTLKKMAICVIVSLLLAACNKTETNPIPQDPNFEVMDCPKVNDPIKELPWLAAIVNTIMTDPVYKNSRRKIYSCLYKGKTIYLSEALDSSGASNKVMDGFFYTCEGNLITSLCGFAGCGEPYTQYNALRANLTKMTLIFEKK
jgi:hypothetical protein